MEEGDPVPSLFMFGEIPHNSKKSVVSFLAQNTDGPYETGGVSSGRMS